MDKVISARLDESAAALIGTLAVRLKTSKKNILESAIKMYAEQVGEPGDTDVFQRTSGAWNRKESVEATIAATRKAFRESMTRRQR